MASLDDLEYGKPILGVWTLAPATSVFSENIRYNQYERSISLYNRRSWNGYTRYEIQDGEIIVLVDKVNWGSHDDPRVYFVPLNAILKKQAAINSIYRWPKSYADYLPITYMKNIEIMQ